MKTRLILGAIIIATLVGVFWLDHAVMGSPIFSRVLLWLLALAGLAEALQIGSKKVTTYPGLRWFGCVAVVAVVMPSLVTNTPVPGVLIALAALGAASVRLMGMAPLRSTPAAFPEAVLLGASILYVPGLLIFLDRMLFVGGLKFAFAFLLVSKTTDMAGYLVGSTIGRVRIAPALSPKKSWEGTIAGVLGAAGVAALLSYEFGLPPWHAAICGAMIGIASFVGDLIESGLKRWAGVKDSATLVPEFGGALDMLDGILVAAPVAAVLFFGS